MDDSPSCSLCGKPAGDMAGTVAYAGIPIVTLCDPCTQAALGVWDVGRAVAVQVRDRVQARRLAKEGA